MTPCKFHSVPKCRPGFPFDKKQDCRKCWYLAHSARSTGLAVPVRKIVDCPRFGEPTGEERPCLDGCAKGTAIKLFSCSLHTVCTPKKRVEGAACCEHCPDRPTATIPLPLAVKTIDSKPLKLGRVGEAFNSSLLRFKGRLLLCYRTGWAGARLHVAELNNDLVPQKVTTLEHLGHPRATVGQEDPRLFEFQGRLHVSFTGVERVDGAIATNVLYARLTDHFRVEEVFAPVYYGRRKWEKNWTFFEWEGVLLAVYSIAPHVILHIRGNQAYPFAETRTEFPWSGGHLRGGCPPVRVGDTFYHWFHGRRNEFGEAGNWLHGVYTVGLYTFPAKWPFAIERMTPKPIWEGNYETLPDDQKRNGNPAVVFPAGAVHESGRWSVSMGVHDRWTDVAMWDAAAVDAMLGIGPAG